MKPAGTFVHKTVCRSEDNHRFGEVIRDDTGVLWLYMQHEGPTWRDSAEKTVRLAPMLNFNRAWCGCRMYASLDHLGIILAIRAGERVLVL
jgi:hypothetical protein